MKAIGSTLPERIKRSGSGVSAVIRRPKYSLIGLVFAFLISILIYFSINYSFYGSLMLSPMALGAKFGLVATLIIEMTKSYANDPTGGLLLFLALVQGITLALLVYNIKRNRRLDTRTATSSGLAAAVAVVGLGCVPCGTSLLIPLMTLVFASSAPAMLGTANVVVLIIAGLLSIYALYKVGYAAWENYMVESTEEESESGD